jgi:hypothetical protein
MNIIRIRVADVDKPALTYENKVRHKEEGQTQ